MACFKAWVTGDVQGVGFRHATALKARELGVTGYAKNLADGRVEVLAQGREERIEALRAWLNDGPRHASVDALTAKQCDTDEQYAAFTTA
ncbi:acylphosphatase [Larsenimonas salina]|uniref:acylphosphatase n=1 Tax=Larsenimonas salina TaxID=1295565 RepID=UPI0020738752|nr:acylphosphatase [Larsenimonas salina]MCM5703485.1 acylphosphatase [Larsenimonas salina]